MTPGEADGGDVPGIPGSIEFAWGLRGVGQRGPKRGLTLERIVAAGIDVARTEGVGALSMARIAAGLGVGTMSLYRYVRSKDELLGLMVDTALGSPDPDADWGDGWREGLTAWAVGVQAAYRRHPWALRIPISSPPLGPNNVAWLERALGCLASTPLTEQQKLSTVLLLSGFVRNDATLVADLSAHDGKPPTGYGAMLARLIDASDFPALSRAIDSGALDDDEGVALEFEFGLARILDGVESLIRSQRAH